MVMNVLFLSFDSKLTFGVDNKSIINKKDTAQLVLAVAISVEWRAHSRFLIFLTDNDPLCQLRIVLAFCSSVYKTQAMHQRQTWHAVSKQNLYHPPSPLFCQASRPYRELGWNLNLHICLIFLAKSSSLKETVRSCTVRLWECVSPTAEA